MSTLTDYSRHSAPPLPQQSRETLQRQQLQSLRQILRHAWTRSSFYREYYGSHGIREKDLSEICIEDLPFLSKQILMDNFDGAVTDPRLKRKELEQWIQDHTDPRERYSKDFIVIHSSGSSGNIGIFVYDQKAWRFADSAIAGGLPPPENYPSGKTKVAFYAASHGHFAMVSIAAAMPRSVYDTLILSLLDSREHAVTQLNAFQPHRLHGYSSSVTELAELAIQGKLHIHPKSIFVAGDKLAAGMEKKIREAWGAPIYVTYGTSESKYIAVKSPGQQQMTVMEDLNLVEVLDDANQPVSPSEEGRVVLTNLYNYTLPILRYELGEYVVLGTASHDSPFTTIREIKGRVNDALPVILQAGKLDNIHPIILNEFFVAGLEKVQFVSKRPDRVRIDYIATQNIDTALRREFQRLLDMKGASQTLFEIRRVQEIANDPQTGKLRLIQIEHDQTHRSSGPADELDPSYLNSTIIADEKHDNPIYKVVENHREQYSLWRADDANPVAWEDTSKAGSKAECLAFIKEPWTATRPPLADHLKEQRVHQLFEEQARRTPNSVGVVCEGQVLTYDELNARANQLAHHLRVLGVGPEALVAICVRRSLDMVVGILGILKAGGAWLPLDPLHPRDRQQHVFDDAHVEYLLTQESLVAEIPEHGAKTVLLDSDWAAISQYSKSNPENVSAPTNLAYIMYTSGSTGQPKGVMITHANLSNYVRTMGPTLGVTPQDVYLHTATIAFSSSVRQLMVPLTHGAKIVVATTDEIRQPLELFEMIKRQMVTVLDMVPSYWRNSINLLTSLDIRTRTVLLDNHVRLILTASEPLLPDLPKKWTLELKHSAKLINMFGQTETTGIVATYPIPSGDHLGMKNVPIGVPISNMQIYLLDAQRNPVPLGTAGEVYVGGPGVGRGYLNQPELTAERFVPDPFGIDPGGCLYWTGDLARYRPDGNIEFLGRIDDQVKIRGIRIEPGEIEAVLGEHLGVQETAVVAREDELNEKRLVAYIVPKRERTPTTSELRDFLKDRLPEYMIPSAFVMLAALPLTPSGKIDRRALPAPDRTRPDMDITFVAAHGAVELQLTKIWETLLGMQHIGVNDDFFDLGGHSFLAVRMFVQIVKTFGKSFPLAAFFQAPTIKQLAKLLSHESTSLPWSSLVPLQPNGTKPPFFWVHGDSRDVDFLLPSYLGADQPLYEVEQPFERENPVLYKTVGDLVSHYLSEIRTVQPEGPYFLGGYCFGGVVAFEMSQQLRNQGQDVALLVLLTPPNLIDCKSPRPITLDSLHLSGIMKLLRAEIDRHLGNLVLLGPQEKLRYILVKVKGKIIEEITRVKEIAKRSAEEVTCKFCLWLGRPIPPSLRLFHILGVYRRALRVYAATVYPGQVTVLKAEGDPRDASGWDTVAAGGLDIHVVPGDHETVVKEPSVRVWAALLRDCLVKAQAKTSGD